VFVRIEDWVDIQDRMVDAREHQDFKGQLYPVKLAHGFNVEFDNIEDEVMFVLRWM